MNFCSNCGSQIQVKIPEGDDRKRYVCDHCGTIHYQNPKMVVGAIPVHNDQILLCRRAIEPAYGKWTLPAGYLENGETVSQGTIREAYEEAYARLDHLEPYAIFNLTFVNQLYFIFRATLTNSDYQPGVESLEVKLFNPDQIPWDDIGFNVIRRVLNLYTGDLETGFFPFRVEDIFPNRKPLCSNTGSKNNNAHVEKDNHQQTP